jgi:hypothetical protein
MANETLSSTYATQSLSYALAERVLGAANPKIVVAGLANDDDIGGLPTKVRQYPVFAKLSAASSGSEGTEITTNTTLSMASAITATPSEGALIRSEISDRAVEIRFPGVANVEVLMQVGSLDQQLAALGPEADRLSFACLEKMETDLAARQSSFTDSAGTSGQDCTVADLLMAKYLLKAGNPLHEDWAYILAPNQLHEISLEIGVSGGGLGGGVWFQQGDASFFNHSPDASRNGYRGTFMGVPVYEQAQDLAPTANDGDDVVGSLVCVGKGVPGVGQLGGIGVVRNGGLKYRLDYKASMRGAILVVSMEYAAFNPRATHGVKIVTDAP